MIWWIWSMAGYKIFDFDVRLAWEMAYEYPEVEPDVYWLGECAWTCMEDNTNLGLKTV